MRKPLHIACGASHTLLCTGNYSHLRLLDDGEAYSWGEGFYGALGIGKLEN
jgi:alpha-tubulin suppressor-like RCC1 family protein